MSNILVAEHNEQTAQYIYSLLKKAGNCVTVATNSLDAWRACGKTPYDALVVDVAMPGIDSFVLAQKALQDDPCIQIVFVTGFAAVAMDTLSTPVYAPIPVTGQPFHLREIARRLRYLTGETYAPLETAKYAGNSQNNVIYADFAARP